MNENLNSKKIGSYSSSAKIDELLIKLDSTFISSVEEAIFSGRDSKVIEYVNKLHVADLADLIEIINPEATIMMPTPSKANTNTNNNPPRTPSSINSNASPSSRTNKNKQTNKNRRS